MRRVDSFIFVAIDNWMRCQTGHDRDLPPFDMKTVTLAERVEEIQNREFA
jgi:hypothetical protein